MKRLLLILILTFSFQIFAKAADIRDFQIEGMSIGDSLLEFYSKKKIINKINSYEDKGYIYNSRDYYSLTFYDSVKFKNYDAVQFHFKDNDNKYKIYSISGIKYYKSNINDCDIDMKTIEKEFDSLFLDTNKKKYTKRKHAYDKTGKSTTNDLFYNFSNKDYASITCYNWSKDINIEDQMNVSLTSDLFDNFINTKAYK